MRLGLAAPAKVNLYLHVLGRRADGYHRLDSLVAFTVLHDWLEVAPAQGLTLAVRGDFAKALEAEDPESNLVIRAARSLAAAAGVEPRAAITLEKRIPLAAGLGGGSADAAAALRLLNRLWRLGFDDARLAAIGLRLGADVPMCLDGWSRRVGGVGERLGAAFALPDVPLVLVNPGDALVTRDVFRAHGLPFSPPLRGPGVANDVAALARGLSRRRNDLTAAATSLVPAIATVLAEIATGGSLLHRMSGSGATCFGIFADAATAERAAAYMAGRQPMWWVRATAFRLEKPAIVTVA